MNPTSRNLLGALAAAASMAAAQAATIGNVHVFPMPSERASVAHQAQVAGGPVNYYGGSVFSNVRVVAVMWNSSVSATIKNAVPGFSAALVNSSYVDQMSQYDTFLTGINGHAGTNQHIGRGSYAGMYTLVPSNTAKTLTDLQIQTELLAQIAAGHLPSADANTLYMMYFPKAIKIKLDGSTSCLAFGAYHSATQTMPSASNVFYTVEPDCGLGLSNITVAASHEFVEAMTDNIPTPGSSPAYPQAWNSSTGYEVGDLCSTNGKLTAGSKSWTVTQYYLNTTKACSTGNYTSP